MSYSEFIYEFKNEFYKALETKTNWGRNELKVEFERATVKTLVKFLERTGDGIFQKAK